MDDQPTKTNSYRLGHHGAPCDLSYERNTEKYGSAMKLTIALTSLQLMCSASNFCHKSDLSIFLEAFFIIDENTV